MIVPNYVPDLGNNPRTFDLGGPPTYTPIIGASAGAILGDDNVNPATGLWVKPGATVTIKPNWPAAGLRQRINVLLDGTVYVEGTLVIGRKDLSVVGDGASPDAAAFSMWVDNLIVTSTGKIDGRSGDQVAAAGGNSSYIDIEASGSIVNAGTIDGSGGNGTVGGLAASIYLEATCILCNSGTVEASGGTGSNGAGGGARDWFICGSFSDIATGNGGAFNLGSLVARGGDGTTGGGNGGYLEFTGYKGGGAVVNAGLIDTSGGDATVNGSGGNAYPFAGDTIYVHSKGGSARIGGDVKAVGGNGAGGGNGGHGGRVKIETDRSPGAFVVNSTITGGIYVGSSIDTSGGTGSSGGNAGNVYIGSNFLTTGHVPDEDPIVLVGYDSIDLSGGQGSVAGGAGGNFGPVRK